jgi:glycosyltransferase involved in cell wall biosynthesis/lysophospholipase L1-like esterase
VRILFIAPLPPPRTGHSIASRVLLDELRQRHDVDLVDLSRDSGHDGRVTPRRLSAVARLLVDVWRKRGRADVVYLTISESLAGNVKDLCIYLLCAGRLRRMVVHLHGGTIGRALFDRRPILRRINRFFVSRLAGVVVTGPSHAAIFDGMIDRSRVYVVANCAQEDLFVAPDAVDAKFDRPDPLRVVYISAMTELKGCEELADAALRLPPATRERVRIQFAGRFETGAQREAFLRRIQGSPQIEYVGEADDQQKARLFGDAHVFCLPTKHLEGQPIAILEAYASGCVVVTTCPSGIRDVFAPGVNGFEIRPSSADAIRQVLEDVIADPGPLRVIARLNAETARAHYHRDLFTRKLGRVIESAAGTPGSRRAADSVKNVLLFVGFLGLGLVLAELGLTLLSRIGAIPQYRSLSAIVVRHDVLGYALPRHVYEDTDENGYRNPSVPPSAEIVVLGDSQSYGYNALSRESWPKQLERMSGHSVYNMAVGGHGPAQYYHLLEQAFSLKPKLIIVGFYIGNDVNDACAVFGLKYWQDFAKTHQVAVDGCDPIFGGLRTSKGEDEQTLSQLRRSVRYSNLLMLLKQVPAIRDFVSRRRDLKVVEQHPNQAWAVTLNTGAQHIFSLDAPERYDGQGPPWAATATEVSKWFLTEIRNKAAANNVNLLVVLIPNKADVFVDYFTSNRRAMPVGFSSIIAYDTRVRERLKAHLATLGVPTVDALPMMAAHAADTAPQVYFGYLEDHPTRVGYQAIAEAVLPAIPPLLSVRQSP